MISFKQFLQEKALNQSTFAATLERLSDKAKLGFEIEVWVNQDSDLFIGEPPSDGPQVDIDDLRSFSEWREVFRMDTETASDIRAEYLDWKGDGSGSWSEYYQEEFDSANDFVSTYDLEPLYGWVDNDHTRVYSEAHEGPDDEKVDDGPIREEMALALADVLGKKVHTGYTGKVSDWVITTDGSVEGEGRGVGLEIVSPPTPVNDSIEDLQDCFRFIDKHKLITNSTTGLHLNLSIPDLARLLDPLKLVLFMGEDHVLAEFGREGNTYAKTHAADILRSIERDGVPPKGSNLTKAASAYLTKEKYRTINLSKLKAGYLEFRAAGGTDYHANFSKVMNTIGRFLTVLELACDPTAERKEYLKKVTKLFGKTSDDVTSSESLYDLVRKTSGLGVWNQLEGLLKEPQISRTLAARYFSLMIQDIGELIEKKAYEPSPRLRAEFKQLLGKFKKAVGADFLEAVYAETPERYEARHEKFLKAFGLWGK